MHYAVFTGTKNLMFWGLIMKTSLAGVQMVAYCLPKMSIADFFRRAARKFFVDEKIWFFFGPQNTSILIKYTFSARSSHSPKSDIWNNSQTPPSAWWSNHRLHMVCKLTRVFPYGFWVIFIDRFLEISKIFFCRARKNIFCRSWEKFWDTATM